MFADMRLEINHLSVEMVTADFLARARLQPLGELPTFLNDRRRSFIRVDEVELSPMSCERQMQGVSRPSMSINKKQVAFVSLLKEEEAAEVLIMASGRNVVFYIGPFAVNGKLHINADAKDEDLLDDSRDFYAVSDVTVYPVESVAAPPQRKVPLLFVNRARVDGYHPLNGR
jgi:hypothetical protein